MVRAGCVFVAGIHPSRTWTSGSFESVRWNACVHRLDLGLYSHPKEFFWGMEFEPMLTPREKSPLLENVPRGGSNPRRCGQRAQALPTELFRPLFHNLKMLWQHTKFCPEQMRNLQWMHKFLFFILPWLSVNIKVIQTGFRMSFITKNLKEICRSSNTSQRYKLSYGITKERFPKLEMSIEWDNWEWGSACQIPCKSNENFVRCLAQKLFFSCIPVTLNQGQGLLHEYQNAEFSSRNSSSVL